MMGTIDTISASGRYSHGEFHKGPVIESPFGGNLLSRLADRFQVWANRHRSRAALAKLTDRELADIGISRAQADFEISRPFWEGSAQYRR